VRKLTGIRLHDVNCGFKAYRSLVLKNVRLYGEMHRFVPVLAHWKRFRIGEIVVEHHARQFGYSKFGGGRFFRGLMEPPDGLLPAQVRAPPGHFFGGLGASMLGAGGIICGYLTVLKIMGEEIGHRPLLILGVLLVVVGVQVFATGLIAELLVHQSSKEPPFVMKRLLTSRIPRDTLAAQLKRSSAGASHVIPDSYFEQFETKKYRTKKPDQAGADPPLRREHPPVSSQKRVR